MNSKLKLNLIRTIKESRSRFIAIMLLILIGTTVLVGLSVSGNDMRSAAMKVFDECNTMDLMVYSDYGIQDTEMNALRKYPGIKEIEETHIAETVLAGTGDAFRLTCVSDSISKYKLTAGRFPETDTEIALDDKYNGRYKIGDTLGFSEDSKEVKSLTHTKFKIVGFVLSTQIVHKDNKGTAYAGSGELEGYGVITESAFDTDWFYGVQIVFDDLRGIDRFSDEYQEKLSQHRDEIDALLRENAEARLEEMKKPYQDKIDEIKLKAAMAGPVALKQVQPEIDKIQKEMDKLTKPYYYTVTPKELDGGEGLKTFETVAKFVDLLGVVFPWILYLVIALVTFANVNRFVAEERGIIGTLKGLGYSERDIFKKFIFFGILAGIPGVIIGMALGFWVIPHFVHLTYAEQIPIFDIDINFYPSVAILAIALALLNTLIPIIIATARTLHERTSDLLKAKAPKPGTKVFLEKIKFIWSRLSFLNKVTARNLFRYKPRMIMTIVGVASAVGLVFAGLCLQHSISSIEERQYSEIQKFNAITMKNASISEENEAKIKDWHANNKAIESYIEGRANAFYIIGGEDNYRQYIHTIITDNVKEFPEYFNLMDYKTGEKLNLEDGAIISQKMADGFGLEKGDTLKFYDEKNERKEVKVAGICEMYVGNYLFMSGKTYEEVFQKPYTSNANLVILKDQSRDNVKSFAKSFMKNKGSETVLQSSNICGQLESITDSMGMMVTVLILLAMLMTFIIVYNLTNINMTERMKELSTIKVLGFRDKEVTAYLFREIFTLSAAAAIIGWGLGLIFNNLIQNVIKVDEVMFNPEMTWLAFVVPPIVVLVTTALTGIYFHFKFKKIDMLKALQAPE